jgi:hypothetical protein
MEHVTSFVSKSSIHARPGKFEALIRLGDTLLLFLSRFLSIYISAAAVIAGFVIGCFVKPKLLLVSAMILAVVALTVGYRVTVLKGS